MRALHVCAALTGGAGLALLALAHHAHGGRANDSFVLMAAIAQMSAAAAGLALAPRGGRVKLVAAGLILLGANVFAGTIYASVFLPANPLHALAPIGGGAMILGWLTLAFARPDS